MRFHYALPLLLAVLAASTITCDSDPPKRFINTPISFVAPASIDDGADEESLTAILATHDLATGHHRFAFALIEAAGLVQLPIAQVRSYYYPDGHTQKATRQGPFEEKVARFHEFPLGKRGIYVVDLNFIRSGDWSARISIPKADGSEASTEIFFPVPDQTLSPDRGDRPPSSNSRTINDVASITELTTGTHHDPGLYDLSIAEGLNSDTPLVVVFASPAFCTNAICGPQVEMVSKLRKKYGDLVNFIHVDLYQNPHEIQGDLDRAIATPILEEWRLKSQEWTFVIDRQGVVRGRFENFAPLVELERSIRSVIE